MMYGAGSVMVAVLTEIERPAFHLVALVVHTDAKDHAGERGGRLALEGTVESKWVGQTKYA